MKTLKKVLLSTFALLLVGCSTTTSVETRDENTLLVSATLDPHARILEEVKPILKEEYGIDLEITVLDDYYIFNRSLNDGDVDANFFQHVPFFEENSTTNGYDLVNVGGVHIEPFGIYSKVYDSVADIQDGAQIIISNSVSDNGRILSILASEGLITLPEDKTIFEVTISDIDNDVNNPNGYEFIEIKPELLVSAFNNDEGDLVAINGNYAIQGELNPTTDAIILEEASQDNPYVNIVACKNGNQDLNKIKALIEVLQSETIKQFILDTYQDGSVIPAE